MNLYFYLILLLFISKYQCRQSFNVTENKLTQINGLNVFNILSIDMSNRNRSILDKCVIISLNGDGTNVLLNQVRVGLLSSISSSGTQLLEIDRKSGDIILKSSIDREAVCNYRQRNDLCELQYMLSCTDIFKEFSLRIIDVNDNYPIFRDKIVALKMTEGSLNNNLNMKQLTGINNGRLELPRATDADSNEFGLLKYSVKFDSRYDINAQRIFEEYLKLVSSKKDNTGEIVPYLQTIKILDRESVDRFEFTLVAWDRGGHTGECRITVSVEDINDNAPVWIWDHSGPLSTPGVLDVSECSTSPAKELLKLHATDADDPTTPNGQVEYSVASVETRTGESVNSNHDLDGLFYISGDQSLHVDMTRLRNVGLTATGLTLKLRATDGGNLYSEARIDIRILDCNDHRPSIDVQQRTPRIMENEPRSVKLTTIVVKDLDRGQNANFDCSINEKHRFQLRIRIEKDLERQRQSGRLVIYELSTIAGAKFDREVSTSVSVMITCIDKGVPSHTTSRLITILIDDENDKEPTFERDFFTFNIKENSPIGSIVGRVKAIDGDSGENGRVSYSIIENDDNQSLIGSFSINNRGEIQNQIDLDREKLDQYRIIVKVRDHGKPISLSSSCTVSIIIDDLNDCRPEIQRQYYFNVVESHNFDRIHVVLGTINATDRDEGNNGKLRFSIHNQFANSRNGNLIKITNEGQISIFGTVDREKTKTIQTDVLVHDMGEPSLHARTTIIITVLDVNDNSPKFLYPNSRTSQNYANITIGAPAGTTIAKIIAEDPDNGLNGTVTYKLFGNQRITEMFDLHESGQLILMKSPTLSSVEDDSKKSRIIYRLPDRLMIEASDAGTPNKKKTTTTLYLRYLADTSKKIDDNELLKDANKENEYKNPYRGKYGSGNGGTVAGRNKNNQRRGDDNRRNNGHSTNMTLLYGLAVVLFVVFAAVLILLGFVFLKSRKNHGHQQSSSHIVGEYIPSKSDTNRIYSKKSGMGQSPNSNCNLMKQHSTLNTMNIRKSMDDLLSAANFYDLSNQANTKENYNQLLWMQSEPHYNLLYPTQTILHQDTFKQNQEQTSSPILTKQIQQHHHLDSTTPINTLSTPNIPHMTINNLKQTDLTIDTHDNNNKNNTNEQATNSNINSNANVIITSTNNSNNKSAYVTSTFV